MSYYESNKMAKEAWEQEGKNISAQKKADEENAQRKKELMKIKEEHDKAQAVRDEALEARKQETAAQEMKLEEQKEVTAEKERDLAKQQEATLKQEEAAKKAQQEVERIKSEEREKIMALKDKEEGDLVADIAKYEKLLDTDEKALKEAKTKEAEAIGRFETQQKKIDSTENEMKTKRKQFNDDIEVMKKASEDDFKNVAEAIKRTGQTEGNVGRFLRLTAGLLGATEMTTKDTNAMASQIKTFGALIERECCDKLTITQYSQKEEGLQPFVQLFADQGIHNLRSLKCRSDEEFDELLLQLGTAMKKDQEKTKGDIENQENVPAVSDDAKEEEVVSADAVLEQFGLKKRFWDKMVEEGWDDAQDWPDVTGDDLKAIGIKGGNLKKWGRMIEKLGDYNISAGAGDSSSLLTAKQKGLLREICRKPEMWEKDEAEQEEAASSGLKSTSPALVEFFGRIHNGVKQSALLLECARNPTVEQLKAIEMGAADPTSDDKKVEENAVAIRIDGGSAKQSQLMRQSYALRQAALSEVSVAEQMQDAFAQSQQALTVAEGVEDSCKQIIKSQGTIREAVLLAAQILDLKPANMENEERKKLWAAVDRGVIRFASTIKMAKATDEFFGFFLRFQSSFQYYQKNADKSLVVSLRFLNKEVNEFTDYQEQLMATVKALDAEAMQCIKECVEQQIGADNFEAARKARDEWNKKMSKKQREHDEEMLKINGDLQNMRDVLVGLISTKAGSVAEVDGLSQKIERNRVFVVKCQEALTKLKGTVIQ